MQYILIVPRVGESCHDEIADGVTPGTERNGKDYVGFTNMAYAAENGEPTQSGERNGKGKLGFIMFRSCKARKIKIG